ncbi:serine hydrolase FSH [Exophiala viscosa]|uniref:Serine hydrolase FSH n=1 Tax=Exophiala viscosa TaxID=2486360 RepID=A0AAN6IHY4_9EURO|nr:serine hydrolase FSH [Exophiala viscosa]KAI1627255.1 serine hydrolase FSH [Exophiala viscosa]
MRLLCLHGYGTNAAVLQNQLQVFLSQADREIEPFYLEGEIEAPKAASLGAFTTGPFYCYYDAFDPANVKKALEMLDEVIEEEGPFDGIVGFSQGGSLAVAYMVQHEIDHADEPLPFKFAIIFSSVISFSPDDRYCDGIIRNLSEPEVQALSQFPATDFSLLQDAGARKMFESMAEALSAGQEGGFLSAHPDEDVFARGDTTRIPRIIHPDLVSQRIRIPTVHVVGKQDDPLMIRQSQLMYQVCDPTVSKWLEHSGGHDVPRQLADAKAAVKALEWAISESQQQVWARL